MSMSKPRINEYLTSIIARVGNPIAPLIIQYSGEYTDKLGRLLAPIADPTIVNDLTDKLLQAFDPADDTLLYSTEFIITLATCLHTALIGWTNRTVEISRLPFDPSINNERKVRP